MVKASSGDRPMIGASKRATPAAAMACAASAGWGTIASSTKDSAAAPVTTSLTRFSPSSVTA